MENITNEIIENVTQKQPRGRPKTGFNKKEYHKKRYELNKDLLKEQSKETSKKHYQENKDKILQKKIEVYNQNKDIINQKSKQLQSKYRRGFKLLEILYNSGKITNIDEKLYMEIKNIFV